MQDVSSTHVLFSDLKQVSSRAVSVQVNVLLYSWRLTTDSRDACATGLDCQENKERNERHERGDLFSQASGGFEKKTCQDHGDLCV